MSNKSVNSKAPAYTEQELREMVIGNPSFIPQGNRAEAYQHHCDFEAGFEKDFQDFVSFEEFCKELDKGYCGSDHIQIARLAEVDGIVYYDQEYYQ